MPTAATATAKAWRDRHTALGLCVRCNQPVVPGRKSCEHHLQYYSNDLVKRKQQGIRRRASKRNPQRTQRLINRLWHYEPYLRRDWQTAEPWIREHIDLWLPHEDNVLIHAVELKELTHMFNVYLDGLINYLENGLRLGTDNDYAT